MRNALSESVGNYAKEGGSESRARRPPLHSSQRARLENRGLTSYRCAEMIWCLVLHIGNLNCEISVQATKYYIVAMF